MQPGRAAVERHDVLERPAAGRPEADDRRNRLPPYPRGPGIGEPKAPPGHSPAGPDVRRDGGRYRTAYPKYSPWAGSPPWPGWYVVAGAVVPPVTAFGNGRTCTAPVAGGP